MIVLSFSSGDLNIGLLVISLFTHAYIRQLIQSRDRIATGLKKLLETNELVVNMEVNTYMQVCCSVWIQ